MLMLCGTGMNPSFLDRHFCFQKKRNYTPPGDGVNESALPVPPFGEAVGEGGALSAETVVLAISVM